MTHAAGIPFVSRAGIKLEHALREFKLDVTGMVCADFGCNVGGFTDCLLRRGAAKVHAIDTGYGTLAWKLRNDPRVVVMERTNALHAAFPSPIGRGVRGEGAPEHKPALDPKLLDRARELRAKSTDAESLLWGLLRNRRLLDLKFRRQHPIKPYVLDFYCDELRLAIELDGGQHILESARRHDQVRTQFLERQGIRVLRFWDHEMLQDTDPVLEAICLAVAEARAPSDAPSPPAPLPAGEGGGHGVDLVTIDLAWTPQRHAIPAALRWLRPGGRIISLIKPHYELGDDERDLLVDGLLAHDDAERVFQRVLTMMPSLGVTAVTHCRSPITGGKSGRKARGNSPGGNIEFLALLAPTRPPAGPPTRAVSEDA